MLEIVHSGDVVIMSFNLNIWIDKTQRLRSCFNFGLARLVEWKNKRFILANSTCHSRKGEAEMQEKYAIKHYIYNGHKLISNHLMK